MNPRSKDPSDGLTAAGRKEFARKEGAHLRPGVKKRDQRDDARGHETQSKLVSVLLWPREAASLQKKGKPTFALSVAAWGEPVPTTKAAARKIAEKGRKLLERYQRTKDKKPRRSETRAR
jgi:hypothetical protein